MIGTLPCVAAAAVRILISLAVTTFAIGPSYSATGEITLLEKRLDNLVRPLLDEHKVPGAAVVVIDGDQSIVRGYGLRRAKSPGAVGPETVFEAASLGKPVFAYAMLKQTGEYRLDLDHSLSGYLDEPYVSGDDRIGRVTVRHVLSHTTGFPNWRPGRFSARPEPLAFLRDPGEEFGYSGEGYMYLQAVTEKNTSETLDAIMRAVVFHPNGMTKSSYLWSDEFEPDVAMPHGYWGQVGQKWRAREAGVAYSLHTTASDYARFLRMMLSEDNEIAEAMLRPQIDLSDGKQFAWALGWGIERRPDGNWFWHWGDNVGYKHFVIGSRSEGRAVLVLTNARRGAHVYRAVVEEVLGFLPAALEHPYIQY